MAEIIITKENFDTEVLQSDKPVLLDFWATWCGPCRMLSPIISEIAEEYEGKIKVGRVNVDEEPDLANEFSVEAIPTIVIMQAGKVVRTSSGYYPKEYILSLLPENVIRE